MEQNKLWFKRRKFGWGWTPNTWQGWSVLVMYLFSLLLNAKFLSLYIHTGGEFFLYFLPQVYILTVFLCIICYATGEEPKWSWGRKEKDGDTKDQN